MRTTWPKGPTSWIDRRTLYVSVPFTWNLPAVRARLRQADLRWDRAHVGGPAVDLMPDYLAGLPRVDQIGGSFPGVLQRVNPDATRTTTGCIRRCPFCGVGTGQIEPGGLRELDDWPDRPILCDNNLLAASRAHFDRVMDRLEALGEPADFNQGLDARLLTRYLAERLARLPKAMIRLAADAPTGTPSRTWHRAVDRLREAGLPRARLRSYALVGQASSTPEEAWDRCRAIEAAGVDPLPMWFHRLDALEHNPLGPEAREAGWTETERRRLFIWFYFHRTPDGRQRAPARQKAGQHPLPGCR